MRNLKRALSLTLASVMLLGMMVVGSSALSFNDADDITNVTAASVLEDLGIMQGDGSGNFMPDKAVTRAQMAIIVCRILYGNKLNVSQFEGTTQYTDVGANDYYTGYINLATQLGIIGGYGDGRFGPNDTVTTAQAALMLSRALGYFKGNEIAQASDWALAAIAQAAKIKMFGSLNLSTNAELARDNVAEMVFNTITAAVPVQYNELLGVYYNENKGIVYALTFYYTDTLGYKNFGLVYRSNDTTDYGRPATTWGTGSYNMQNSGIGNTGSDQYGLNEDGSLNPAGVKMLKNDEIITVAYEPSYTYTAQKKQDEVYKDLGRTLCTTTGTNGYTWTFYLDGDLKTGDDRVVPTDRDVDWIYTGDGMNTEIYVDSVNNTVRVVSIWNYMAEVLRVREDDDGRYIDVRVGNCDYAVDTNYHTAEFAEDDYVIVNIDNNERERTNNSDEYFIQDVYETAQVEGTVREVHRWVDTDGAKTGAWIKLDDASKHDYSALTWYDVEDVNENHPDLDAEYRLYKDPNGFVVGFQALADISRNYLYVTHADTGLDTTARVVFADGTSKTITVDDDFSNYKENVSETKKAGGSYVNNIDTYSNSTIPDGVTASNSVINTKLATPGGVNAGDHKIGVPNGDGGKDSTSGNGELDNQRVFRYSVDKNGVYTLTQLSDNRARLLFSQDPEDFPLNGGSGSGTESIVNGAAYITVEGAEGTSRYIVDKKTAFVDVDDKALYTGYDEVPNYLDASFYVVDVRDDKVADVVFIIDGEKYNDNSTYFYVTDINAFSTSNQRDFGYDVARYTKTYVDGTQQDILVDYDKCVGPITAGRDINEIGLYKIERENDDGVATAITKISGVTLPGTDTLLKYRAIAATASGLYTDAYQDSSWVGYDGGKPAASQWVVNDETVFVIISGDDYKTVKYVTGSAGARYIIDDSETSKTTDRTTVHVVKWDKSKNVAELVYVVEGSMTVGGGASIINSKLNGMTASAFTLNGENVEESELAKAKPGDKIGFTLAADAGYSLPASITINGRTITIPENGEIEITVPKSGSYAGEIQIGDGTDNNTQATPDKFDLTVTKGNGIADITVTGTAAITPGTGKIEMGQALTVTVEKIEDARWGDMTITINNGTEPVQTVTGTTAAITVAGNVTIKAEAVDTTAVDPNKVTVQRQEGDDSKGSKGDPYELEVLCADPSNSLGAIEAVPYVKAYLAEQNNVSESSISVEYSDDGTKVVFSVTPSSGLTTYYQIGNTAATNAVSVKIGDTEKVVASDAQVQDLYTGTVNTTCGGWVLLDLGENDVDDVLTSATENTDYYVIGTGETAKTYAKIGDKVVKDGFAASAETYVMVEVDGTVENFVEFNTDLDVSDYYDAETMTSGTGFTYGDGLYVAYDGTITGLKVDVDLTPGYTQVPYYATAAATEAAGYLGVQAGQNLTLAGKPEGLTGTGFVYTTTEGGDTLNYVAYEGGSITSANLGAAGFKLVANYVKVTVKGADDSEISSLSTYVQTTGTFTVPKNDSSGFNSAAGTGVMYVFDNDEDSVEHYAAYETGTIANPADDVTVTAGYVEVQYAVGNGISGWTVASTGNTLLAKAASGQALTVVIENASNSDTTISTAGYTVNKTGSDETEVTFGVPAMGDASATTSITFSLTGVDLSGADQKVTVTISTLTLS